MENQESPKRNKGGVIIAILAIIVIIQSIKIFMDYRDKKKINQELSQTHEELSTTITDLQEVRTELTSKIEEIKKLGGDITELTKAKEEIEKELKQNKRRSAKSIQELQARIEGYRQLLVRKDEEIETLKNANQELFSAVTTLKSKQNQLGDSIQKLAKTKKELNDKVQLASQLRAENVEAKALNERGKERESPFRNRQLDKLKISFAIADNKVAPIGARKFYLRVLDASEQPVFDVAKSGGTLLVNGKEVFYTMMQEVLFDNSHQTVTFLFAKGSDYVSGNYVAELYCDSYLIGRTTFAVK